MFQIITMLAMIILLVGVERVYSQDIQPTRRELNDFWPNFWQGRKYTIWIGRKYSPIEGR